jgi:hypothetical protein
MHNVIAITVLRDPLAKYLSAYFYFSHKDHFDGGKGFQEGHFNSKEAFSNPILSYLALRYTHILGQVQTDAWESYTTAERTEATVHACHNLRTDFAVVGLTEHMAEFNALIAQALGWPACLFIELHSNQAHQPYTVQEVEESLSQEDSARLADILRWDITVYRCATEISQEQLARVDPVKLEQFLHTYAANAYPPTP